MLNDIDVLVVGAGLSGAVAARVLADAGKRVLIVEQRNHIGGNCYDEIDEAGILVHRYGPHLFHTDNADAWEFMERFTPMDVYEHRVKADINGKKVSLPFSLETLYEIFPPNTASIHEDALLRNFEYGKKVTAGELLSHEEPDVRSVGQFVYDHIFKNYTIKQWDIDIEELDAGVSARVPIYMNRDTRYFTDRYQGVPRYGYTKFFNNLLDHDNIHIMLKTPAKEVFAMNDSDMYFLGDKFEGDVIYTGSLDEIFDYDEEMLPYRSVELKFETYPTESYQEAATVNYPNNYAFTRITEFRKIHPYTNSNSTTILKEYPVAFKLGVNERYYPITNKGTRYIYENYYHRAHGVYNFYVLGRLGEYKYYDMDDVIAESLKLARRLVERP